MLSRQLALPILIIFRTELFLGKPENEKPFMATVPMGRGATPQDVANTCAFLASEEAAFLTGNAVEVDGGRCV
jgi:NAD(P)-dependent dehydrogenase (short-subunit alcohol dehydrogenase family)